MNKKILIIGNGFIGKNLYKYFIQKNQSTITTRDILNILDKDQIQTFFMQNHFDYIIYAVGIKDIKKCEISPDLAYNINANGVLNVLNNINSLLTKFVYISTDYVFDGESGNYSELSETNPQTVYGKSKILGEQYTLQKNNTIVVRTSGVYGSGCLWLTNLLNSLSLNEQIICFSDVYNSPTYAINLAEMIEKVLNINFTGIINLSGSIKNNRYDLYSSVATIFEKNTDLLSRGTSNGIFPKDISLNNKLYQSLTNNISNNPIEGLTRFKNEY
jgi:dTDP-4-dehydrorhamnose reductase